ncbi:diguanylate cyclase [Fusibacter sp. 3D3]|uniref:diguanylate cyclase n=1 Tax=Fusibacter sp. 3D3 TaxID=1048380 RepID=UPI000853A145|nr:diguanylate cyclase [Fusibacter sp. 3D3]GAU77378.1 diguanylate cyclase/phosphodiesterase [Fusibacter sp. 3D3]
MKVINNRYHVLETLSRESSVVEYLVEDTKKNHQIKRIRIFDTEISNYEFMKSMEENFVDISTYIHDQILTAYEFKPIYTINGSKVTRKQFFYTYEHYDENLTVPYFELNKSEINSVIVQLCKAIRFLHFRGIIYKYLNFNAIVLLRENGQIKLKLKDIANNYINDYFFKLDHERYQQFIAPEILWGEEVDNHADIYSLGVMFYYLYYRVDFTLKSLQSLSKNVNNTDIHKFILKASNHIKDERHDHIQAFIDELTKLIWIEVEKDDIKFYDRIHEKTIIVGRDAIITECKEIIFDKMKKIVGLNGIYIQGENGIGKSRVLKELEYTAKFNRIAYVTIDAMKSEEDSFYAIKEIISFIATQDDVSPLLIQKYGQELAKILPELTSKWNLKEMKPFNLEAQKMRLLNRAFNFFVEYSNNKYMILLVDDEEYIHPDERYFFDQLVHHKGHANFMLIFTGVDQDRPYQMFPDTIRPVKLPFLNLEETGKIVQKSLGISKIPYRFTHRIMIESMGKPNSTKRLVKKLWLEKVIFFDQEHLQWNLDQVDDGYKFEYAEENDLEIIKMIEDIVPKHIEILKKIAVLKGAFNLNVLLSYAEIDEEQAYYFIFEMESKKILNKRISDVEYVFGFYKNEVKKYFVDLLSVEEVKSLSQKAASIYEHRFKVYDEINETLIDYLIASENFVEAAQYSALFSKYYIEKSNSHKGIDLLEQASQIYDHLYDVSNIIKTSKKLIKNYISIGKLDKAYEKILFLIELTEADYPEDHIDAQLELADIYYYKYDINKATDQIAFYFDQSQQLDYLEGEFKSAQLLCRCFAEKGDLDKVFKLIDSYLAKAKAINHRYYTAVFLSELGRYNHFMNRFDESLEAFNNALDIFNEIEDEEHIIKIYNNFGVIYLDELGDYIVAREYFRKAYNKANARNHYVSTPIHLNNLGETYKIEGKFQTAIKYFEESYLLAENVGDKNMVILSLLNLCYVSLLIEHYGKTHTLINRLEHEISAIKNREFDKFDYFMLHFEYFITMNSVMKVEKWRYDFDADEIKDDYRRFRIKVIDLIIKYRKSALIISSKQVPFDDIKALSSTVKNPTEAMLVRNFLLDIMIDFIDYADFIEVKKLIKLDDQLVALYNTKHVRLKRAFIDACRGAGSFQCVDEMIPLIKEESQELLWRAYKFLGDDAYHANHQYNALKFYLMSLDIIADLSIEIAQEYKETYILYDDSKMTLKNRINKIIKNFLNFENTSGHQIYFEERIDTVDDYFDLNHFNLLYQNKSFVKSVYEHYKFSAVASFQTPTDLIKSLGKDDRENLQMILRYLIHMTIAERGMIYMLDVNDNIDEIIKTSDDVLGYDILKLINSIGNDLEGVYISKLDADTNVQILSDEQKGIIFFPIYESVNESAKLEKRREDLLIVRKRVVGYVFLDTNNVINRFNPQSFNQSKSFMNLIYLMMDNYNLKLISSVDKLTGVQLRKAIELAFTRELNLSRQNNTCLSVIMLDIDKFKNVNDTYGHRKGDEILSKIGELLNASIRNTDYVGRYGGEEFVIILPETNVVDGLKVAEKIRSKVAHQKLLGEEMPLTVSLGVSTYPDDGVNEEELVEKADQALYYSKNNGRNQSNSWHEKLVKAGHRYDKLAGILTGNISADTRNVQALTDILAQLENSKSAEDRIKDTFITLLDITEAEEICFIKYDENWTIKEVISKKKGHDILTSDIYINQRLLDQFQNTTESQYFIDWEESVSYDKMTHIPNWKSYIVMSYNELGKKGILSISVPIHEKELDFSNYNFVETLKLVISYILF